VISVVPVVVILVPMVIVFCDPGGMGDYGNCGVNLLVSDSVVSLGDGCLAEPKYQPLAEGRDCAKNEHVGCDCENASA
jgi:hypothetical protein